MEKSNTKPAERKIAAIIRKMTIEDAVEAHRTLSLGSVLSSSGENYRVVYDLWKVSGNPRESTSDSTAFLRLLRAVQVSAGDENYDTKELLSDMRRKDIRTDVHIRALDIIAGRGDRHDFVRRIDAVVEIAWDTIMDRKSTGSGLIGLL